MGESHVGLHGAPDLIDGVITPTAPKQSPRHLGIVDYRPFEELGKQIKKNRFIAGLRRRRHIHVAQGIEVESTDKPVQIPVHKQRKQKAAFTRVPPLASMPTPVAPDSAARVTFPELIREFVTPVTAAIAALFYKLWPRHFGKKTYAADTGLTRIRPVKTLYGLATVLAVLAVIFLIGGLESGTQHKSSGHGSATTSVGGRGGGMPLSATNTSQKSNNSSGQPTTAAAPASSSSGAGTASAGSTTTSGAGTGLVTPQSTVTPYVGGMGGGYTSPTSTSSGTSTGGSTGTTSGTTTTTNPPATSTTVCVPPLVLNKNGTCVSLSAIN